jgi:hypothetical protein
VLSSAALAAGPIVRHTAKDQAAARAVVLKSGDLGTGWTGGVRTVTKPAPLSCPPSFVPRQDDLVITGDVESSFQKQGVAIGSEVALFAVAEMVRKDWSRSIRSQTASCLGSNFRKEVGTGVKLLSARKVSFPAVAPMASAYRLTSSVTQQGQAGRLSLDFVFLGKGRYEITLTFLYPQQLQASIVSAERRIARVVAGRVHA